MMRRHPALVVGLAFIVGTLIFAITFQVVNRLRPGRDQAIVSPGQRRPGSLALPMLAAAGAEGAPAAGEWSLEKQRGKVVLVNYFATWCPPCMAEFGDLQAVAKEYAPRGVVTAAVSLDRDGESNAATSREQVLREFVARREVGFPILLPPPQAAIWTVDFPIPQTYLYDRQGRLAWHTMGQLDAATLRGVLEQLLKEPS